MVLKYIVLTEIKVGSSVVSGHASYFTNPKILLTLMLLSKLKTSKSKA